MSPIVSLCVLVLWQLAWILGSAHWLYENEVSLALLYSLVILLFGYYSLVND